MNEPVNDTYELKPCPFCGGEAEIYTDLSFPYKGKSLCKSEEEAQAKLKEYKAIGTVADYFIGPRVMQRANMKNKKIEWGVVVEMKAFIPRCCNSDCLGRTRNMFLTEREATIAWNRRAK